LVHLPPIEGKNPSQQWRPQKVLSKMEPTTCKSWYKLDYALDVHIIVFHKQSTKFQLFPFVDSNLKGHNSK
jgi:hypothetical protein